MQRKQTQVSIAKPRKELFIKYTPEEMLELANSDPNLRYGAINAMMNNTKGFGYFPIDLEWIHADAKPPYVSMPAWDGTETENIIIGGEDGENKEIADLLRSTPRKRIKAFLMMSNMDGQEMDVQLLIVPIEKGKDEYDSACNALLLNFFELAGIDTKGRLKKTIEKG